MSPLLLKRYEVKPKLKEDISALPFLLPFTILYFIFTLFPVFQGIFISFHRWSLMGKIRFVGLQNYVKLFHDPFFYSSFKNTLIFVLLSTPTMIITSLSFALLANRKTKVKKFLRTAYYMPCVLSVSVISYITIFMAQPYMGFINGLLHSLKLIPLDTELFLLTDPGKVWGTIIVATIWWTVGFNMMLYISALQDIPEQVYEAANIDGANEVQKFFRITLPQLAPITKLLVMLQIIASFKVFSQIFLITKGGPGNTTRPLIQYIYATGFQRNHMGYSAAISYILFIILLVLGIIQIKINKYSKA